MTVLGVVRSIVQVQVAGVASTLPTRSMARTSNVWAPAVSPVRSCGVTQAAKPAPSSWHSNAPASVEVKANCTSALLSSAGGMSTSAVSGGVRSVVQVADAGVASVLPAASVAATVNVCAPSVAIGSSSGDAQGVTATPSSVHANVTASGTASSVAANVRRTVARLLGDAGPGSSRVSGAVVSDGMPSNRFASVPLASGNVSPPPPHAVTPSVRATTATIVVRTKYLRGGLCATAHRRDPAEKSAGTGKCLWLQLLAWAIRLHN